MQLDCPALNAGSESDFEPPFSGRLQRPEGPLLIPPGSQHAGSSSARSAYEFAVAAGYAMVGTENAFAVLLDDLDGRKWIAVFGDLRVAHSIKFEEQAAKDALDMAQALNASFSVVDGAVHCEISGRATEGSSYAEAALMAVVRHQKP
ncbi:hypothetical protein [Pseudorhodoferax soli]|uniref:Uncharacterized protein n=1 Tax=Pseudorhodoferax soli TaxID=545864 RepID=A0A368XZ36_9BURK|nr:hypothetical protein [Pseudorhodoferax soli]RCW71797.1 hypothetical protein DES41_104617 [Pseudorhodoferax soli]